MDNRPIGIFDSGVGGLTVAAKVLEYLPNEKIVYFGDTARVPYGSKSKETVTKFSKQILRFLLTRDVKAVIVACNTASSNSLEALQESFDLPIFGVVNPGAVDAARCTRNKKVGVIGTAATIRSRAYEILLQELDPEIMVFARYCPLFVPLVEEGWTRNEVAELTIRQYLAAVPDWGIDTLVMGCTHYPLLRQSIAKVLGEGVTLIDPAEETARLVKSYLENRQMLRTDEAVPKHDFFVSDLSEQFAKLSDVALHHPFIPSKIDIEAYET